VSTLLHATVYMLLHNLLNVLVQIANKMGLKKCGCRWHMRAALSRATMPFCRREQRNDETVIACYHKYKEVGHLYS
jgi:hypothetical protein